MIEDHLTPNQRIRLEALNQANARNLQFPVKVLMREAQLFEKYIKSGELDDLPSENN